jgi:hypothetical protein
VFEEGNAFTMEAVQQQLDDLAAKHEAQVGTTLGSAPFAPQAAAGFAAVETQPHWRVMLLPGSRVKTCSDRVSTFRRAMNSICKSFAVLKEPF